MMKGIERNVDKQVIHPLVIGYFFSNLSPIKPAAKLDTKPKTVKFIAFNIEYCALKPGYDLRKKMGKKLAIAASEKWRNMPPNKMYLVVLFFKTSRKLEVNL
jgi:hypothetical protein